MGTGKLTTTGSRNIAIGGFDTLCANTTGGCNIALGAGALENANAKHNIALGQEVAKNLTSGCCNVFIGVDVAKCGTVTGSYNAAFGRGAGCELTGGHSNVFLGRNSGGSNTTGHTNVYIGHNSGYYMGEGYQNIAIGKDALLGTTTVSNNTGDDNIAIGRDSGRCITDGGYNLFLGVCAGYSISTGEDNIFLGRCAGNTNTSGSNNIALGCKVELPSATGVSQLAIGTGSSRWITGDSSYNVCLAGSTIKAMASGGVFCATSFVGDGSNLTGVGLDPDADKNLVAGTSAGSSLDGSSGCFNIFFGECAGKSVTSGSL